MSRSATSTPEFIGNLVQKLNAARHPYDYLLATATAIYHWAQRNDVEERLLRDVHQFLAPTTDAQRDSISRKVLFINRIRTLWSRLVEVRVVTITSWKEVVSPAPVPPSDRRRRVLATSECGGACSPSKRRLNARPGLA